MAPKEDPVSGDASSVGGKVQREAPPPGRSAPPSPPLLPSRLPLPPKVDPVISDACSVGGKVEREGGAAGRGGRKAVLHGGKCSGNTPSSTLQADQVKPGDGAVLLGGAAAHLRGSAAHLGGRKAKGGFSSESDEEPDWNEYASSLVHQFYYVMANVPVNLHLFYNRHCDVTWTFSGRTLHMTTPEEVEASKSLAVNHFACYELKTEVIHVLRRTFHTLVRGECIGTPSYNFMQTLVWRRDGDLITSEILEVYPQESHLKLRFKPLTPAVFAESNDSEHPAAAAKGSDSHQKLMFKESTPAAVTVPAAAAKESHLKLRIKVSKTPASAAFNKTDDTEYPPATGSVTPIHAMSTAVNKSDGTKHCSATDSASSIPAMLNAVGPISTSRSGRRRQLPKHYRDNNFQLAWTPQNPSLMIPVEVQSTKNSRVCVVYDPKMLGHKQVPEVIPEVPGRVSSIYNKFEQDGLLSRCDILQPQLATFSQLELVHAVDYVQFVFKLPKRTAKDVRKFLGKDERINIYFSEGTKEACFLAVGSVIKACDSIGQRIHDKAFCVIRPPGHHAKRSEAGGFCFFNNLAVGVFHLLNNYASFKRILVVDFDVHHGNGTQSIFYNNQHVMFVSIHSSSLYPEGKEGNFDFIGEGAGVGYNMNIPLEAGYGDSDLILALEELLVPLAKQFNPDAIFISAGFDAAKGDKVGRCNVTETGFAVATDTIVKSGSCPVVMVLEGGYHLPVLAECASHCLRTLLGEHHQIVKQDLMPGTKKVINNIKKLMSRYWDVFK